MFSLFFFTILLDKKRSKFQSIYTTCVTRWLKGKWLKSNTQKNTIHMSDNRSIEHFKYILEKNYKNQNHKYSSNSQIHLYSEDTNYYNKLNDLFSCYCCQCTVYDCVNFSNVRCPGMFMYSHNWGLKSFKMNDFNFKDHVDGFVHFGILTPKCSQLLENFFKIMTFLFSQHPHVTWNGQMVCRGEQQKSIL